MVWNKHPKNPLLTLRAGHFDSNHIHAPMVVKDGDRYRMWYSGSDRGTNEYHRIGYAESRDGIEWARRSEPVIVPRTTDGYVTTPAILRNADGSLRREEGLLKLWFGGHNLMCDLHLATSRDGITWTEVQREPLNLTGYASRIDMTHKYFAIALAEKERG